MIISYLDIEKVKIDALRNNCIESMGLEVAACSLEHLWDKIYKDTHGNEAITANKFKENLLVIRNYIDDLINMDEEDDHIIAENG